MHRYIPMEKVIFRNNSLIGLTHLLSVNESRYNYDIIKPSKNSSFTTKMKFLESCNNVVYLNDISNINNVCDVLNDIMESLEPHRYERSIVESFINNSIIPKLKDFNSFYSRLDKSVFGECTNSINDTISIYTECDRILNNNKKLCKRFNINKFLRENITNKTVKDPKDIVFSLCEMIDTYNISPKKKYHIALENIQYSLYNSPVNTKNVVKYITDYFLLRESIIPDDIMMDYIMVVNNNEFIEPSELSKLKFVKNDERKMYLEKIKYIRNNKIDNNKTGILLDYLESINTEEQALFYIKNVYNTIITDSTMTDNDKDILKKSIYMIPLISGIDKLFLDYEINKLDGTLLSTRDLIETVDFINESVPYNDDINIVCSNFNDIIEEFKRDQDKSPKKFIKLLSNVNPDDSFMVDIIIKNIPELLYIIRYTYVMSTSVQSIDPILQELLYFIDRIIRNNPEPERYTELLRILNKEKQSIKIDLDSEIESKTEQYVFILNKCINNIKTYMNCTEDIPYNESCLNEFESDELSFEEGVLLIETLSCGMNNINNLNKEELLSSISDNIRLFTTDTDNLRGLSNVLMVSNTIDKSRYEDILIQRKEYPDCDTIERSIIANEMYYINNYKKPDFDIVTESLLSIEATNILIESFFENGEEIVEEAFGKNKNINNNKKNNMKKKNVININTIKLAFKAFEAKLKKFGTKVQTLWKNIDIRSSAIMASIQKSLKSDRREAIIKGRIIPSMSQCIKYVIAIAGTSAVGSLFGAPYLGVITAVGIFASNKLLNDRERILIYEEIDTELKVLEKEIELALQDGNTEKYRFLLTYQKKLQREKLRIKYGKVPIGRKIPV